MLAATVSDAADFEYIKIADTNRSIPGGTGNFTSFDPPALSGGHVAFRAAGSGGQQGVYSYQGTLTRVIDKSVVPPGASATISSIGPATVSGNHLAFEAVAGSSDQAIYATQGGLHRAAANFTPMPGSASNFTSIQHAAMDGDEIAFYGFGGPTSGIYTAAGGVTKLQVNNTFTIPNGVGTFGGFGPPAIDDEGNVAFGGNGALAQLGVYSTAGGLHRVADRNTPIPGGIGNFTNFLPLRPSIDGGDVAFQAEGMPGLQGIYAALGGNLQRVADTSTAIPGGSGNFTGLTSAPSLEDGQIAFSGSGFAQIGVYLHSGGTLRRVIDQTHILDGKPVIGLFAEHESLSDGNVAFRATFFDGSVGVFVAISKRSWNGPSGAWESPESWRFNATPNQVLPTSITPEFGALVTGPAAATTIRSLEIGAQLAGVAELRLQPTGHLSIVESLDVLPLGKVSANGGVLSAAGGIENAGDIDLGGGQINGGAMTNFGTIRGNGTVGGAVVNSGRIQAIGEQMRFTQSVLNAPASGLITGRDAVLEFAAGLDNAGALSLNHGANDVIGDVTNTGSIVVTGGAAATFHDDMVQNGTLRVSAAAQSASTAVFLGDYGGVGSISGGGDVYFEGDLRPGASPAAVTMDANVSLGAGANVKIELGGTLQGDDYDHIDVTGQLSIDGALTISLINGFTPSIGQSFDVLDWGAASGSFSSTAFPALPGAAWDLSQLYTDGVVSVAPLYSADFDQDGDVDGDDLGQWQGDFGPTAGSDADADGDSDGADFLAWQRQLGSGSAGASPSHTAVPEPPALTLACLAAFLFGQRLTLLPSMGAGRRRTK